MKTDTLLRMRETKAGYRTENYSGSSVRKLYYIIVFEISELGNTDIVSYVQNKYKILTSYSLGKELTSKLKKQFPKEYHLMHFHKFTELCQSNADAIATEIVEHFSKELNTPTDNLVGLWLTTYNNAGINYNSGKFENIDKYPLIDDEYYVISNLGEEGSLFVFKNDILKSRKENYQIKFYDTQTGNYSAHETIEGLFEMLCEGYCECGEGYDHLDKKDGKMKCLNCLRLNNLESITEEEMINYIQEHEYVIENI